MKRDFYRLILPQAAMLDDWILQPSTFSLQTYHCLSDFSILARVRMRTS